MHYRHYRFVTPPDMLAAGLRATDCGQFGPQLWSIGKVRGQPKRCAICDRILPVGQLCFRPIKNGMNRMHRICQTCAAPAPVETT